MGEILTTFVSPTLLRKFETTSSNLSCPTSMQSVCLIVLTLIFLSDSFAVTSKGASGFSINISLVLWTGTLRCISTFAAADDAMGLMGPPPTCGSPAPARINGREALSGEGITIDSPHEGQSISLPAPELSTANSWSHFGQVKITSIGFLSIGLLVAHSAWHL